MPSQTSTTRSFLLPKDWPPKRGELWMFDSDILLIQDYDSGKNELTVYSAGKISVLSDRLLYAILSSVHVQRISKKGDI